MTDFAADSPSMRLADIQYDLPDDRIARFPLVDRDQAKLLIYKSGQLSHRHFFDLPAALPPDAFLVFNNTKVIPARLHFRRTTGAAVELFLLNPATDRPLAEAMLDQGQADWDCMIGNGKRWKPSEVLDIQIGTIRLMAERLEPTKPGESVVRLSWLPAELTFADVIHEAGQVPLPPYLNRDATEADRRTYQTTYARHDGAVAAPTAGLHFTDAVFEELAKRGIRHDFLTLHVGAGTFQPIKTEDVRQHRMHHEEVVYTRQNVENYLAHASRLIPVGTTSMRALESLYWIGVQLLLHRPNPFLLDQGLAYDLPASAQPPASEALNAVLTHMKNHDLSEVVAHTGIFIRPGVDSSGDASSPGYSLKLCKGLITNFHQPGSTLILLIATLLGPDWRRVYADALAQDYRFLSYGDSSLLLP
jgi:S-adenosylmethionine:tRNA ribosyltransferase-isomerase